MESLQLWLLVLMLFIHRNYFFNTISLIVFLIYKVTECQFLRCSGNSETVLLAIFLIALMGIITSSGYEPIEKEIPAVIILYCIIVIQISILTIMLFHRWRIRRVIAIRYLSWSFSGYVLAFICFLIGVLEGYITGYKRELYRHFLGFGYFFFMLGHFFFVFFAKEIYSSNWKNVIKYLIFGGIVAILVVLPQNYYGYPTGSEGPDNIRLYSSCAMLFFSLFLFGRVALHTYLVYRKMTLKYARLGFLGFLIGEIAMVFVFLFILADFIYLYSHMLSGYSVFYYFAVISGMISIAGFFIGIFLPPKLQSEEFQKITEKTLEREQNDVNFESRSIGIKPLPHRTGEKPAILIQCPKCLKYLYYEISDSLRDKRARNPKELVSIRIPPNLICEHSFLVYLDKEFGIRSYTLIDLTDEIK